MNLQKIQIHTTLRGLEVAGHSLPVKKAVEIDGLFYYYIFFILLCSKGLLREVRHLLPEA